MKLYLVQHAEAKTKDEDPERSLTKAGQRNAEAVAKLAAELELEIKQIRHSGKKRAEQTALILAEKLNPSAGVSAISGLAPLDDVKAMMEQLSGSEDVVMLVGHLPFMARFVGQLIADDPELSIVNFQNAGILCLSNDDDHWQVEWNLTPDIALV